MKGSVIIFVSGPSGVGKTTVVKKLTRLGEVYVEDVGKNPHFSLAANTFGPKNWYDSQSWFLEEVCSFVRRYASSQILIIDQAPAATVEVYARYALRSGRLKEIEFEILCERLASLEQILRKSDCIEIILRGSPEVLHARAMRRDKCACPSQKWFDEIAEIFSAYATARKNAVGINTDNMGEDAVYQRVLHTLHDGFKVRPNGSIG